MTRTTDPLNPDNRLRWWMIAIVVVVGLPALLAPMLAPSAPGGGDELVALMKLMPLYAVAGAILSLVCWRGGRPAMAWIIVALMALSDVAVASVVTIL